MAWDPPVSRRLMEFISAASAGTLAAFDADGTLWGADAGESFLKWAGDDGKLAKWPKGPWAWVEYERRIAAGDLRHAFGFCLTAFAELADEEVARWAREFIESRWGQHIFPEMRQIVRALRERDAEIWVVSGSPSWVVIPGAEMLGIPQDHVIAGMPKVEGGVIQDALASPLPLQETKVELLVARAGRPPHFAAGNSEYDFPLLESARTLALAINPPGTKHLERKNGANWIVQRWPYGQVER